MNKYNHIQVDDKVLVKNEGEGSKWHKRHFAGVNEATGEPLTWMYGKTSWSGTRKVVWTNCKLPEESE